MTASRSDLMRVLEERSYVYQVTDHDGLDARAVRAPVTGYIGFDCTAPSLHVGSLVQIMMLRRMQQTGHKPIVLIGGGTTKVGDPSGKDESRTMLDDAGIEANKAGIQRVFSQFLSFGNGPTDALMVDNAIWLDGLQYIPFLRDFGSYFSVNRMLGLESVKRRLEREQPLSFLEFNYTVLQAYDFLELARRHDCVVQLGGSDQWGNIVSGVELGRRVGQRELFGLTSPLITTAGGSKMGKTAQGAVWLNSDKSSCWDYWQFWRNTDDEDVARFLRLFTDVPLDEIVRLEGLGGKEINHAKIVLATEATRMCHGDAAAQETEETGRRTFVDGESSEGLPRFALPAEGRTTGIPAFEVVFASGLVSSKGEARKLIRSGGVRINDTVVPDETTLITATDLTGGQLKLSLGKKRHAIGTANDG